MFSVSLGSLEQKIPVCIRSYHELCVRPKPEQELSEQLWMPLPT